MTKNGSRKVRLGLWETREGDKGLQMGQRIQVRGGRAIDETEQVVVWE